MPESKFILQGFRSDTHLEAVRWVIDCPSLERAVFSVAFINQGGVGLLESELQQLGARLTVFAGIRNSITSRQGLESLLGFGSILYAVDTGARSPLFHPKVFFAQGATEARVVVGSANLTAGGLNNNIEASVRLTLDRKESEDEACVSQILAPFDALPTQYPSNVVRVHTVSELAEMEKAGRLLDESLVVAPQPAGAASKPADDNVPKIKLVVEPVYPVAKKPKDIPAFPPALPPEVNQPIRPAWQQVWISKPLAERDLSIPKGENTHPTGSINLDKGLLADDIDHRHYFREEVFKGLDWNNASATVDEAEGVFQLVIKGIEYGEAQLRVAHTTSTTSAAYSQRNAMTRLSWGPLKPSIADQDLLGRRLTLYRDAQDPKRFLIEID